MTFITIAALVIILVIGALSRAHLPSRPEGKIAASPVVKGEVSEIKPSPSLTLPVFPSGSPNSVGKQGSSNISINVGNPNGAVNSEKLIFPGAIFVKNEGSKSIYETSTDADTVYNWYVAEMEKRSFAIRNKIKTKANEKVKAVVSGSSVTASMNVTLDQENTGSKTQITLE